MNINYHDFSFIAKKARWKYISIILNIRKTKTFSNCCNPARKSEIIILRNDYKMAIKKILCQKTHRKTQFLILNPDPVAHTKLFPRCPTLTYFFHWSSLHSELPDFWNLSQQTWSSQVWWIVLLLLLTTSAWPCLQHSLYFGPTF